jgi:RNA polymerase sigma factor (sigma-70 family)
VEASALHAPSVTRVPLGLPLLRLRSDDQLLALFRAGSEDAFGVIHDRYRQRLFAYVRQMLSPGSRQDAEDVMQDVFVRAYGALRADNREVNLRAWLYRVAHNRCIDHLRRPTPPAAEIFEMSRKPLHDPIVEAQRREDLSRLVEDVGRLPEQQRSALLMREIDGMSYADLAAALDVTVPAVKSLLVRARVGLVEAAEARDADCCEIRDDLLASYDRGVKASGRARKHMRSCAGCREYRGALRGMRRSFAALTPVGAGIGTIAANLLGLGGSGAAAGGSAAAAGGGAAGAGGAAVAGGTLATATAGKLAAVVATAAITAGGAVEVNKLRREHRPATAPPAASAPAAPEQATTFAAPTLGEQPILHRTMSAPPATAAPTERAERKRKAAVREPKAAAPAPAEAVAPAEPLKGTAPVVVPGEPAADTGTGPAGGVAAPEQSETDGAPATTAPGTETPATAPPQGTTAPQEQPASAPSDSGSTTQGSAGDGSAPPSEH